MAYNIKELQDVIPGTGIVKLISRRPAKRADVEVLDSIRVSPENGLEGDHYSGQSRKRQVTLIQDEHLQVVAQLLGKLFDPRQTRRNLVVSGINLLALNDRQFSIGEEVVLQMTGHCHPCSRMEDNLGPGGYQAMRGHGGITCRVVRGGTIRKGDSVRLLAKSEELPVTADAAD